MNPLALLKSRFQPSLAALVPDQARVGELLEMIRPAQDAKFGDYQANFAMPLKKDLGQPPQEIARKILAATDLGDVCQPPEVAGPGFINLRLRDDWLTDKLNQAVHDDRLGIPPAMAPRTFVIDYSSPNVAKPMHVGHIRSTVIGDALCRTLRFLGHRVISDNHLGDWGTQFGMIIYGYKHFVDRAAYQAAPVAELSRLYKLVHQLVDFHESHRAMPQVQERFARRAAELDQLQSQLRTGGKAVDKKLSQSLTKLGQQLHEDREELAALQAKTAAIAADTQLAALAAKHPNIDQAVLAETAKLHADDPENLRLWHEFLPNCRDEIARVYRRLDVRFDYEHGESFYHDRLAAVVEDLRNKGLAQDSQGAVCVFVDGFETPMIVQKKDGAFLYSTTDLATIQYRMETWRPDAILYVVDHRQSEHFDKLFAVARRWGHANVELQHIKFGTVMGSDGKPYKTREGVAAGLESLLDEAVARAAQVVAENDPEATLSESERRDVAEVVGVGGLKFADLLHNRTSDYEFSYEKMLLKSGYSATYAQYTYARCASIFRKAGVERDVLLASAARIGLTHPAERALGLQLIRLSEALAETSADYMPNHLTAYLFDLAKSYSTFFESCPVLKAETEDLRASRLLLCDLTARTIRLGLELLGIKVVAKM
ncbi:MAG: arginine--tRNA ligase [Planctomycetaceae bacterium]|nr:arginine--tRNA ligase [Planctomycetaceae bacterium]